METKLEINVSNWKKVELNVYRYIENGNDNYRMIIGNIYWGATAYLFLYTQFE